MGEAFVQGLLIYSPVSQYGDPCHHQNLMTAIEHMYSSTRNEEKPKQPKLVMRHKFEDDFNRKRAHNTEQVSEIIPMMTT